MEVSPEGIRIAMVLGILALAMVAFAREWVAPELVSMSALVAVMALGLLPVKEAFGVFSAEAPITIAALFVLTGALEKTGAIDFLGDFFGSAGRLPTWVMVGLMMLVVGTTSAFINNTPVVAIFLPVVMGICRRHGIAPSKMLIPLSYAAVLGGCCTLIGTSTNLIVSGVIGDKGLAPLGMFELTKVGLPLAAVGCAYVVLFGPRFLPDRLNVTAILGEDQRRHYLCHLLVERTSALVGRRLLDTVFCTEPTSYQVIEIRRGGTRLEMSLDQVIVQPLDRVLVSVSDRLMIKAEGDALPRLDPSVESKLGVESLSTIEGGIVEGIVAPHSRLVGTSMRAARFRQTYGMVALAVHRRGLNLTKEFAEEPLQFGDTILMLGPKSTFEHLRSMGDLMLLEDQHPPRQIGPRTYVAMAALAGVVLVATLTSVPIVAVATAAAVLVLLLKCIEPQEAYASIEWSVIFMLYGMMAVGAAMERTGTAEWIASTMLGGAEFFAPRAVLPYVMLAVVYGLSLVMTEILSNNATALIMAPIAISTAAKLGVEPRGFIIAVALSASLAFACPTGYQTHMMVYGPGGYRFMDFVRFGMPLHIMMGAGACLMIPEIWPW
ncbi:MAG: SLC13 family permease [Verrucomicrobiae bacterium]|nr:SLC13 family permease [Verrucomicrobiae bacterium]